MKNTTDRAAALLSLFEGVSDATVLAMKDWPACRFNPQGLPSQGPMQNLFRSYAVLERNARLHGDAEGGDAINLAQPRTGNHMSVAKLVEQHAQMTNVLKRVKDMNEKALPKFNWGASHLDATAIALLNEVPGEVNAALSAISAN